jgi:GTP cyclohydrolase I
MDTSSLGSSDGLREPSSWANVQDPVRQMLSALTKAVRTQAAGIRDLDRAVERLPSRANVDQTVTEAIAACATKNVSAKHVELRSYCYE